MNSQKRLLLTLKYLWEKTDEEHPATLKEIGEYLQHNGIETTRKTLQADINLLTGFGIDNRIRQRYGKNQFLLQGS